jgi:heterodisulfide reductase subunit C
VYRVRGDERLKFGLACQTVVQPDMYLGQIPFFPAQHSTYDLGELKPEPSTLWKIYPETLRCLGCGTCTKACPQSLDVKGYMASAMRGDIAAVANKSFDCIMCGLCAARCPAEESQYNVAILARRLYGKYIAPKPVHLEKRIQEIQAGAFTVAINELKSADKDTLKKRYAERDIEPE